MHSKGHSKFTDHAAVLAQYDLVKDSPSDPESDGEGEAQSAAIGDLHSTEDGQIGQTE